MTPRDRLVLEVYEGNLVAQTIRELQQDHSLSLKLASVLLPLLVFLAAAVYQSLWYAGYRDLSVLQLCWNCLVYITPAHFLDLCDDEKSAIAPISPTTKLAAKDQAMRRLLGLDTGSSVISTISQAGRRMSALPGLNKVAEVGKRKLSMLPSLNIGGGSDRRPPGLGNWDNSCYQNSVLQGLAALDSLPQYLACSDLDLATIPKAILPSRKMAQSLAELIAKLNDPANNGRRIWTPTTLKNMSSWQQQDAQEYFSKVLDEVDKEISSTIAAVNHPPGLESTSKLSTLTAFSELSKHISKNDGANRIQNPLEGLLAQRVGCTQCGFSEGLSMIPFNCLTLPLGRAWSYGIEECLDEYTKLETIEGVECGKCTLLKSQRLLNTILDRIKDTTRDGQVRATTVERLEAVSEALEDDDYDEKTLAQTCKIPTSNRVATTKSRQAVIARPPKSLVAHINRSMFDDLTGDLKKNYAEVKFPKTLDLSPWCLGSVGEPTNSQVEKWRLDPESSMIAGSQGPRSMSGPMYELRAVVTHYGRHENGHYVCYRKRSRFADEDESDTSGAQPVQQWWRLSDDDVGMVSESDVLSQSGVFMLFYEYVQPASMIPLARPFEIPPASTPANPGVVRSVDAENLSISTGDTSFRNAEKEISIATKIPLPAESADSDFSDDQSTFTRDEEGTSTDVSGPGELEDKVKYAGSSRFAVPGIMQSSGPLGVNGDFDGRDHRMQSSGNLVMV